MRHRTSFRALVVVVTAGAMTLPTSLSAVPAVAAGASITIADPGAVTAGAMTLRGQVSLSTDPADAATVLFAVDVSGSTNEPAGFDCSGDGAKSAADDINVDGVVGDLLDCELAAVRALDANLAAVAPNSHVGLEAWSGTAALANLDPDGEAFFVRAGAPATGIEGPPLQFVTKNVIRNRIRKYDLKVLESDKTSFDAAINTALDALAGAPSGPKWIMLMSDVVREDTPEQTYQAPPVSAATVARLASSGVRLRSLALGGAPGCVETLSLTRLAAATGEACIPVDPDRLSASLTGASPEGIRGVTLTIGGTSVQATVDPLGGWQANLSIGSGTYTAIANAELADGTVVSTTRSITVVAPAPGTDPAVVPPPGRVTPTGGTQLAARIVAKRPKPTRYAVPRKVRGSVGSLGQPLRAAPALNGARVVLQGRKAAGSMWRNLARATVVDGRYALSWKGRVRGIRQLQVVLQPHGGFGSTSTAVRKPKIYHCKVDRDGAVRTVVCKTTVRNGTKAKLRDSGDTVDRSRVRKGRVTVSQTGKLGGSTLVLNIPRKKDARLRF